MGKPTDSKPGTFVSAGVFIKTFAQLVAMPVSLATENDVGGGGNDCV